MDELTQYTKARYRLWKHFLDEHNLSLLESQLDDILTEVEIYQKAINAEAGRIEVRDSAKSIVETESADGEI